MRKAVRLELSAVQRMELEVGYHNGSRHCFRMRCQALLLKAEGLSAAEVVERTGMEKHTVRKWLKRYGEERIKSLETRPGRGRKPMDCSNEGTVRRAIEQDWQSVNKTREAWQQASESTFKRFYQHWRKI